MATLQSELQEIIESLGGGSGVTPPAHAKDALKEYLDLIIELIKEGGGGEKRWQPGDVFTTTREGDPAALLGYGVWRRLEGVLYGTTDEEAGASTGDGKIARSSLPKNTLSVSGAAASAGAHTHSYTDAYHDRTWTVSAWSGSDPRGATAANTGSSGAHTHTVSGATESMNGNVEQTEHKPKGVYVYHWLRTA